jgi:hypothetical protein
MSAGVFEQIQKKKSDFKDPFKENSERAAKAQQKSADQMVEEAIQKTMSTPQLPASTDKKVDDIPVISEADIALAEAMIFKSYAEIDVTSPNLSKYVFTITTLNAEEINLVDELVYEMAVEGGDKISNRMVESFRSCCFVALSYRGMNKDELCKEDAAAHLNTLKTAVMRYNEHLAMSKLKEAGELKEEIKKKLKYRVMKVRRLSPPIIDFILNEKAKFDTKMHEILNIKGVVPKF